MYLYICEETKQIKLAERLILSISEPAASCPYLNAKDSKIWNRPTLHLLSDVDVNRGPSA
jgi:hypothetical protein